MAEWVWLSGGGGSNPGAFNVTHLGVVCGPKPLPQLAPVVVLDVVTAWLWWLWWWWWWWCSGGVVVMVVGEAC